MSAVPVQHDSLAVHDGSRKNGLVFKTKEFHPRESLLTTLFDSGSEAVIAYNFLAAIFTLFLCRALVDDVFNHGMPFYHLWLIFWNFEQLPATMLVWSCLFLTTFFPYAVLKIWAHAPVKEVTVANQLPMIGLYLTYLAGFFYFPLRFLFRVQLNPACSFIITCETTRIAMKLHSFIRENVPRGVAKKESGRSLVPGEQSDDWPTIEQFVFFLFCPSFIYRDSYPRTSATNWRRVASHATHIFALIEFVNLVFTQMIRPSLSPLNPWEQSLTSQLLALFSLVPAGWICLLCLFYGLLHSWLNLFSELLRFADRDFYSNWWNAANMAEYYRNWNLVVHDWLYAYIYRDVSILAGKRSLAETAVFFASAAFHEYWFGVSLRVFYPVMFLLYFVAGGIFFSVSRFIRNRSVWNTVLYFNLLIGTGMFVAFYGQEWYARQKCAPFESAVLDALLPRHWACRKATA